MKTRITWLIAGAVTAVVLVAVGSAVVALRRGCALADEEAGMFLPEDETAEEDRLATAGSDY